jgi:hypothetical protein
LVTDLVPHGGHRSAGGSLDFWSSTVVGVRTLEGRVLSKTSALGFNDRNGSSLTHRKVYSMLETCVERALNDTSVASRERGRLRHTTAYESGFGVGPSKGRGKGVHAPHAEKTEVPHMDLVEVLSGGLIAADNLVVGGDGQVLHTIGGVKE